MLWSLSQMPAATHLPVPVDGIRPSQIADTFGAPRGGDRSHAGIDIFARRGTPVRSATAGVIADVRDGGLGGRQVWVIGPARERYYYAHLENWAEGLARGQVVQAGDLLGQVGDSGNARARRTCTGASTAPTAHATRCRCADSPARMNNRPICS
jgi:murein DD-endopeptidase MepM/ murein hydrolase activator NlpD